MPTVPDVLDLAYDMLWVTLVVSAPVLLTALLVGVVISLMQTVTGVQEMTITFVPKLVAMLGVTALVLPWMTRMLLDFMERIFALMAGV